MSGDPKQTAARLGLNANFTKRSPSAAAADRDKRLPARWARHATCLVGLWSSHELRTIDRFCKKLTRALVAGQWGPVRTWLLSERSLLLWDHSEARAARLTSLAGDG